MVHWLIQVNSAWYVTIEALSVSRAELMCGLATIVWLAVPLADRNREVS
jgi:hypothetical protein